jgi:hypothetical protein
MKLETFSASWNFVLEIELLQWEGFLPPLNVLVGMRGNLKYDRKLFFEFQENRMFSLVPQGLCLNKFC